MALGIGSMLSIRCFLLDPKFSCCGTLGVALAVTLHRKRVTLADCR
jgi:ABC-type transport system involved in cytochrome c biogenesis permease component